MRFYDMCDEQKEAVLLEMRLAANPRVTARRKAYDASVSAARAHAKVIGNAACIDRLIEKLPAYIRELLETEDERFGAGAIAERYARTFYEEHKPEASA